LHLLRRRQHNDQRQNRRNDMLSFLLAPDVVAVIKRRGVEPMP
jgi:hypothetical protein